VNQNLWIVSLKDFFTKTMLSYALAPFIFTLIVIYGIFFSAADAGISAMQESVIHIEQTQVTTQDGIEHTENTNVTYEGSNAILTFLMSHSLTSWLVSFFIFTIGGMMVFVVAIFAAIFIIGFLTPGIIREIHRRHYAHLPLQSHGNIITTIFHAMRYIFVTLLLLIVLTPLYFIPIINIVAFNIPFYYLFHKFYMLDVSTTVMLKEEYKKMMFFNGNKIRLTTLLLYGLSMIPFAALITPVFNVIVLGHTLFRSRQLQLEGSHKE